MKKAFIPAVAVVMLTVASCVNSTTPPPAEDTSKMTRDTVKIDTVRPNDSIIKG